jgi:hypothetical protein
VKLVFGSAADFAQAGLLSFPFTPTPGPVAPRRYDPLSTSGPIERPRYGIGGYHQFEPQDATLQATARLDITYTDDQLGVYDENNLKLYRWNAARQDWDLVGTGGEVDTDTNTVTAAVSRLGLYTLAPTMPIGEFSWAILGVTRSGSGEDARTVLRLRSVPLVNNDGTPAAAGTLVQVSTVLPGEYDGGNPVPFGRILTADADPVTEGVQVPLGADGTVEIEVELPGSPFECQILAFTSLGTAFGEGILAIPQP